MKRSRPFILATALVAAISAGGVAIVADAPAAQAAWSIGHHYVYNAKYGICWRVDHMQSTAWQFATGTYVNRTSYAVPVVPYCSKIVPNGVWI